MTQQNQNSNLQGDEEEIDLIALAKTLWVGRKTVIKTTLVFMVIGLFVAIFSEKEYTASTTFIPQTSDSKIGGNIGGLAAMAGINIGGMGGESAISLELYPQIVNSISFQKELMNLPITISGQKEKVSLKEYYLNIYTPGLLVYIKKYTIGLPGLLIKVLRQKDAGNEVISGSSNLVIINGEDNVLIKRLKNQISLDVNDKDGYISISVNMPEAIAAAEVTNKVQNLLQEYIINFKIQKSKEQLEYIKNRYLEVEAKFNSAQQALASHSDRNKFVTTSLGLTTLKKLQDEYDLVYSVYTELAKQLEAQYLQVTKDTPVFTIIDAVSVPIEKSKPRRVIILILWLVVGIITGVVIVFGRDYMISLKEKFNI